MLQFQLAKNEGALSPQTSHLAPTGVQSDTRHRTMTVLLTLALLLGVGLRLHYFDIGLARSPDERTYTRQADIVLERGNAGFTQLGDELAHDPASVGLYPSPLRVGYLGPLTLFMRLVDDRSAQAGAMLSLLCSLVSLALVGWTATRFFGRAVGVAAVVFLAVLPFDLTVYRRAWEESYLGLLALASLTLALWLARPGRRAGRGDMAAFTGLTALGLLSLTAKENAGLAFLAITAILTLHFVRAADSRSAKLTVACAGVAAMGYLAVLGFWFGGVRHALWLTREALAYYGINPYNLQWDSGSRWMFAEGLWRASPAVVVFSLVGVGMAGYRIVRPKIGPETSMVLRQEPARLAIAAWIATMLALQVITERYNYRFAAQVYAASCLLAGAGVAEVASFLQTRLVVRWRVAAMYALGMIVALVAWRDLSFAQTKLLATGMQDLAMRMVLDVVPLTPESAPVAITKPDAATKIDLSMSYINHGKPEQALPLLDAVLSEDAANAVAWNNRCVAYTMLHAYPEAIHDCRQALNVQPGFQLAKNNLAWAENEQGKVR